jgi:serine/threonine protein phosphatase PrpC
MMTIQSSLAHVWQISSASVRGKSHLSAGLENQDSIHVDCDDSNEHWCAVVSDGAGTARRSGEGARLTTRLISQHMLVAAASWQRREPSAAEVTQAFGAAVELVRANLTSMSNELTDFNCTMVAWLATPCSAFVAQIGDSIAISTQFRVPTDGSALDFFPPHDSRLYVPDRGEYANETRFLTETDWRDHLRIQRVPEGTDAILLMSDGTMDVVLQGGKVFRGFLSNLVAKLLCETSPSRRDDTIHAWLSDRQTNAVTADDKTLFVAVRNARLGLAGHAFFCGEDNSMMTPEQSWPQDLATLRHGSQDTPSRVGRVIAQVHRSPASRTRDLLLLTLVAATLAGVAVAATLLLLP